MSERDTLSVLLDMLADALADRMTARLAKPQTPEYATAQNNPLGSARAFLDAGRRGDFAWFKKGRERVAKWSDVTAYMESRAVVSHRRVAPTAAAKQAAPSAQLRAFLDAQRGKQRAA
jgi:hypothetical protein